MKNKTVKKVLAAALSMVVAGSMMAGCGSSKEENKSATESDGAKEEESVNPDGTATEETYNIGVLQYMPHPALDTSSEGFFAALDELGIKYKADKQNAAGEVSTCQTIAETLVNSNNDLIFAIATPAAQALASATSEIPIVLTAVTDPADAGLVASNEAPGRNVTGSSDLTPVKEQIALVKKLFPEAKKVGLLYCSSEANSVFQINMAKEACEAEGLEYEDLTVSSSNEIQTVVESAVGNVDVLYSPTDNIVANNMATVSMVANENKLPMICGEEGMVDSGGLITYGIDYYQIGYLAGEMAAKILTGEGQPADMPVEYLDASKCSLKINEETAATLGLNVEELKAAAEAK